MSQFNETNVEIVDQPLNYGQVRLALQVMLSRMTAEADAATAAWLVWGVTRMIEKPGALPIETLDSLLDGVVPASADDHYSVLPPLTQAYAALKAKYELLLRAAQMVDRYDYPGNVGEFDAWLIIVTGRASKRDAKDGADLYAEVNKAKAQICGSSKPAAWERYVENHAADPVSDEMIALAAGIHMSNVTRDRADHAAERRGGHVIAIDPANPSGCIPGL